MKIRIPAAFLLFVSLVHVPLQAQGREVPYWATIKPDKLNMRVGPSTEYQIEWVYRRAGLPIKVVRVVEGWRLIEDVDGAKGWVLASFLSPRFSGLIVGEGPAPMRDAPADGGKLKWNLEPGVVGDLGDCSAGWCDFNVRGHKGWVQETRLWGAGAP